MIDPPGEDAKLECLGTKVTQDADARIREISKRWRAMYQKLAERSDVAELPAEEKLE